MEFGLAALFSFSLATKPSIVRSFVSLLSSLLFRLRVEGYGDIRHPLVLWRVSFD